MNKIEAVGIFGSLRNVRVFNSKPLAAFAASSSRYDLPAPGSPSRTIFGSFAKSEYFHIRSTGSFGSLGDILRTIRSDMLTENRLQGATYGFGRGYEINATSTPTQSSPVAST